MKVLANDGISPAGIQALQEAGFEVLTTKVAQEQLENYINQNGVEVLLVRSATKVRKELIDATDLKIIGRGGVGMDNIDVDYAKSKGIHVINTPAASSHSVAELVFAHLFGMVRFLHLANREMPLEGEAKFKELKKRYSNGIELRGKTLGIIGFGRIGREVAKVALGIGMKVIASDKFVGNATINVPFYNGQSIDVEINTEPASDVLKHSDFISLHVPAQNEYVIGEKEIESMQPGVGIINASRGGVIDEKALLKAIDEGHVAYAALDVFENEPKPEVALLMNSNISLTPHTGGSTVEAQNRIGLELADQIKKIYQQAAV